MVHIGAVKRITHCRAVHDAGQHAHVGRPQRGCSSPLLPDLRHGTGYHRQLTTRQPEYPVQPVL